MITRAIATAVVALLLVTTASAEPLPTWKTADICHADSAPGQCAIYEGRARNAISGSWGVLPRDVQTACIAATRSPADQSWRALAECIDREILQAKRRRAIATAATPAKAEPPLQATEKFPAAEPAVAEPAATPAPAAAPAEPQKAE